MKIIYLINSKMPTARAHGYQMMKMCEAFSRAKINGKKIEVEFLASKNSDLKFNLFEFYHVEKKFEATLLPSLDLVAVLPAKIAIALRMVFFLLAARLCLFFKKYDFIYTREQELAGFFFNNYILEAHAVPKKIIFLHKLCWRRARVIIVLTSFIKQRLVEAGVNEKKIMVSPDGVDLENFDINIDKVEARHKLALPDDKIILGYTGSFTTMGRDKSINDILSAMKILSAESDKYFFIAVGGREEDLVNYQKIVEKNRMTECVKLIRKVDLPTLAVYQKSCDILLMPFPDIEHYRYYMSPLKMFEYMTSMRPIIASDLPSVMEVLNENNSILVKPDNPKDLADGIMKIIKNPELGQKIAEEAYKNAQNYTWEKRVGNILLFILNKI
jgi:glycosyltransferase involved in cell wall biosynthesis